MAIFWYWRCYHFFYFITDLGVSLVSHQEAPAQEEKAPNKYSQKQLNHSKMMTGDFNIVWFAIDKDIVEQFKPRDKIRLEVIDTLGNKYYSKKYRYSKFTEQVNIAKEVNRK